MDVRENRNATIKDIAKTTGFSITTVSLVLNNKCSNIPELTQKTIREVAERLNYKPNYAARTLVTGNSNTIAIIIPDISNVFFAELVNKIQTELSQPFLDFQDIIYDGGFDIVAENILVRSNRLEHI